MAGWEGSCVVDGFFLTYPQQEGCVERHRHTLCAMCTGQHGTVAVSGEMYDEGMGDLMPHGGSIVCFIHRLMAGLSYRSQARVLGRSVSGI